MTREETQAARLEGGASRVLGMIVLLTLGLLVALAWRPHYALEIFLLLLAAVLALAFVPGIHRAWGVVFVLALIAWFGALVAGRNLLVGVPGLVACGAILALLLRPVEAGEVVVQVPSTVWTEDAEPARDEVADLLDTLRDGDAGPCRQARNRLVALGPTAVPALEAALDEDDPDLRLDVEKVLARIRDAEERAS